MPLVSAKTIIPALSIMMPRDIPDVDHVQKVTSFDECLATAREFTERDLTDVLRDRGAIGLKATCAYREMPSSGE